MRYHSYPNEGLDEYLENNLYDYEATVTRPCPWATSTIDQELGIYPRIKDNKEDSGHGR